MWVILKKMKYLQIGLLLFLLSCSASEENKAIQIAPKAIELNNRALKLASAKNDDSINRALNLLDSAIIIQPDYFYTYYNKIIIQNELGLWEQAAQTAKKVTDLKPKNPVLLMNSGLLFEKIGDTSIAIERYFKSKKLFEKILDTISENTVTFRMYRFLYAVNLKLLNAKKLSDSVFTIITLDTTDNYYKQEANGFKALSREEIVDIYLEIE